MDNNILTLKIKPLDTLFFRDGKPFSMGDDSWADGIFPPSPSVIYGAIRSWILANHNDVDIENVEEKTSDLEILEIYYNVKGNTVLLLPLDYAEKKEKTLQERYKENRENFISVERLSLKENNYIIPTYLKY